MTSVLMNDNKCCVQYHSQVQSFVHKLTGYIQYIFSYIICNEVLQSDISHAKGVISIVFVYIKTVNHVQGKH